jgi:hypothetical protein
MVMSRRRGRRAVPAHAGAGAMAPAMPAAGQRRRLLDLRLWLGVALILVSMLVGAQVLSSGTQTVTVWRASRDLAVGAVPEVQPAVVALDGLESAYLPAVAPPAGRMRQEVAAGALVPATAVGAAVPATTRLVTVPVEPMHAPIGLAAGDIVDVWSTPEATSAAAPPNPTPVLSGIRVEQVDREADGLRGEVPVVLAVDAAQVAQVVAAARGTITLVLTPLPSQAAGPA